MLASYTLEELAYEYYNSIEREKAAKERIQQESDMIELAKAEADDNWADEMEAEEEEAEQERIAAAQTQPKEPYDPSKDPNNVEWMEKIIQEEKERLGEDFGEDLVMNFGDDK